MTTEPTLFAVDSSGKKAGVCIVAPDGRCLFDKTIDKGLTHSQTLLALADDAFTAAGVTPDDIGLYAVTAGPGSFTGLRIGVSLVKGLAFQNNTPSVPVSTLLAMATATDFDGVVIAALNARRGEAYWAAFETGDALPKRLTDDAIAPATEVAAYAAALNRPILFVGDGADLCYNLFNGPFAAERLAVPHRSVQWGAARQARVLPAADSYALRPDYIRPTQAERERAAQLNARKTPQNP